MNFKRRIAIACIWAVVAGCGGAVSWESACGCVPASVGLAEDLALDKNTQFTPDVLTDAVEKRFSALGAPVELKSLRSFGLAFEEGCYRRPEFRLRCTFWLWHHEDAMRGIELNLREEGRAGADEVQFSAHYVYESTSR
jgi:hypothetical protein